MWVTLSSGNVGRSPTIVPRKLDFITLLANQIAGLELPYQGVVGSTSRRWVRHFSLPWTSNMHHPSTARMSGMTGDLRPVAVTAKRDSETGSTRGSMGSGSARNSMPDRLSAGDVTAEPDEEEETLEVKLEDIAMLLSTSRVTPSMEQQSRVRLICGSSME